MRILLFAAALVPIAFANPASATEQMRDRIVINGNSFALNQALMRSLWHKHGEEPAGREPMPAFTARSTANWRGYFAMFAIEDGKLYLTRIDGRILGKELTNDEIIPKPFPVHADWYTGSVFVSIGGFETRSTGYRYVIEFSIEKGNVVETRYSDARQIPPTWNGLEVPKRKAEATESETAR